MAAAVQRHDLVGADPGPVAGPFIDQPARDIEGRLRVYTRRESGRRRWPRFSGKSSKVKLTIGRGCAAETARAEMPRQAVADARFNADQSGRMAAASSPGQRLFLAEVAAAPFGEKAKPVRKIDGCGGAGRDVPTKRAVGQFGASAARVRRCARCSKAASLASVSASK